MEQQVDGAIAEPGVVKPLAEPELYACESCFHSDEEAHAEAAVDS